MIKGSLLLPDVFRMIYEAIGSITWQVLIHEVSIRDHPTENKLDVWLMHLRYGKAQIQEVVTVTYAEWKNSDNDFGDEGVQGMLISKLCEAQDRMKARIGE